MAGATIRGREAGRAMAKTIIEMVHLFYQNNTAKHFYIGLWSELKKEMERRKCQE